MCIRLGSAHDFTPFSAMTTAFASLKSNLNTYRRGCNWPLNQHFPFFLFIFCFTFTEFSTFKNDCCLFVCLLCCMSCFLTVVSKAPEWTVIRTGTLLVSKVSVTVTEKVCHGGREQRLGIESGQGQVLARIFSHSFPHWHPPPPLLLGPIPE